MVVLELPPEILRRIGDFLGYDALANSALTCRSWSYALIPVLYRTLDQRLRRYPSMEALARHAHHIRCLKLRSESKHPRLCSLSILPECSNLRELDLVFENVFFNEDRFSTVVLILSNRNLLRLGLEESCQTFENQSCWSQALAHCSRSLQELSLVNIRLSAKDALQLLSLAPTLEALRIEAGITKWSGSFTANPQFPGLKKLDLKNALPTAADELEWIKQCPNLQDLSWSSDRLHTMRDVSGLAAAFNDLGAHHWQKLEDISIWGNTVLTDSQIAILLASCSALKNVWICGTEFWFQSLSALERHFETLEHLEFKRNPRVPFWMSHWFLCRCPKLSLLSCDLIPVYDLMTRDGVTRSRRHQSNHEDMLHLQTIQRQAEKGGSIEELMALLTRFAGVRDSVSTLPWVCLQLKQLSGYFTMPAQAGEDWDQVVFRRLSRLTKLKVLDVGEDVMGLSAEGMRGLQFNLRSGLSELVPLKDLEQLLFKDVQQRMEREDVQWILDQWPKLTNITKDLNTKKIKNRELQSMLTGIRNAEISTESDTDDDESDNRDSSSGDEDEDGE